MRSNLDAKTVEGFGEEWSRFDQTSLSEAELAEEFERYFSIFPWSELPAGAVGFDMGCGSGRWAKLAAGRCGTLYCIDASEAALAVARANLAGKGNLHFRHASVDEIPLEDNSMDFGYSLGVLHHVPDTGAGMAACVRKLKDGAPFLVYLYYAFDNRPVWFRTVWRISDLFRKLISGLPFRLRAPVTDIIAVLVYFPLAKLSLVLEKLGFGVDVLPLSAYRKHSFYTMRTDALDRFGTRLEQRFSRREIGAMMQAAGLEGVEFSDHVPYWCAVGYKRAGGRLGWGGGRPRFSRMYILGLTTLGDSAAALLKDGRLVAAAEEERFSRKKHHSGFPYNAIRFCLDHASIELKDIEHVGHYWKPWILRHKAMQAVRSAFISRDMFKARADRGIAQVSDSYLGMFRHPKRLREHFGPSDFKFHFLEHHQTHAASAFFASPFDSAAVLTWDGTGEETTTLFCHGRGNKLEVLKRIKLPHSLGQFYSAVTNYIGFDMFAGDEWKVMGLAAYGEPKFYDFFREKVLTTNGHGDFRFNIQVLDHHLAKHYKFPDAIVKELGPGREPGQELTEHHWDIASSAQKALEDTAIYLVKQLKEMTGEENLCMAGGVAFNSVMNGRIFHETPFKRFFVQPAAGDAGCSLGSALMVWHQKLGRPRDFVMEHAYWGPGFTNAECRGALKEAGIPFETLDDELLLPKLAKMIADGAIVGWFNGRMELGPRALGARSFVADPRRADMREILNHKVKLREWFRPLAPSMHEEHGHEVFGVEHHDPFMITVVAVAEEYKSRIPAVVHVDGTARPQMVSRKTNPRYWNLIEEFRKLTGIPMLLNTSFNVQEPIVCTPRDAINTFKNANFDALVLENNLVVRG